jgi:hypothetical protein
VDSEIRSSVAYRKRRLHINDMPGMVVLKFAYNFSFGRKYQSGQKRLYNETGNDSGVMKAGK